MPGGTDIRVAEKCLCSWQMRQSPQPRSLVFALVSASGSEKLEAPMALFAAAVLP